MKSTPDLIKARFEAEGLTVAAWANALGYNPRTVYAVLQGKLKAKRGLGHRIAVDLGLKARPEAALRSDLFVTVGQVVAALSLSRSAVRKAFFKGSWHGSSLETRKVHGRGGKAGAIYEVRLSSLPLDIQAKVRSRLASAASASGFDSPQ